MAGAGLEGPGQWLSGGGQRAGVLGFLGTRARLVRSREPETRVRDVRDSLV